MELSKRYAIIYTDGTVWQSDIDTEAMHRLDTESNIISAIARDEDTGEYYSVFAKEEVNKPYLNIINN